MTDKKNFRSPISNVMELLAEGKFPDLLLTGETIQAIVSNLAYSDISTFTINRIFKMIEVGYDTQASEDIIKVPNELFAKMRPADMEAWRNTVPEKGRKF